jgi:hypothetical protein
VLVEDAVEEPVAELCPRVSEGNATRMQPAPEAVAEQTVRPSSSSLWMTRTPPAQGAG